MRLVISHFMSLDGVVQAPGGPEEATDGGKTVFRTDGEERPLALVRTTTAASGVVCCVYRRGETPPTYWEG